MRKVFSTDHYTIGLQYFFLALAAGLIGIVLSLLMRVHIIWPSAPIPLIGVLKPESYLGVMTIHATMMVFFVLSTVPQSGFGNLLLPAQIGARAMAFPRLNAWSFWLTLLSFLIMMGALFATSGAPSTGWTLYPPLSAINHPDAGQGLGIDLWLVSIGIFCIASTCGALNLIVTTLRARARGMTLMRMPLTVWTWLVAAMMTVLAFSVLLAALLLLFCDRHYGTNFYVPLAASGKGGGSPLLWQHLFWFFGHPEVYLAILPGMGVTSHVLATFSRRPVFGYAGMVYSTLAIGGLGFLVWGHHMFVSGMNPFAGMAFSALTLVIAVPSSVKTFNWLATLWRGRIQFTTPMLFSIGFVSLFITGGLTGPMLAQPQLDVYLHDTYFVVAHFHMIMGMAAVFGIFAATYFWFPKMFGRMMNEHWGKAHFWLSFIGAYATFLPMHFLGLAGHPRRYSQLGGSADYLQSLLPMQRFITYAAIVLMIGQVIFLANLFWSIFRGRRSESNPWQATTLEWAEVSAEEELVVYRGPYEFSDAEPDFLMQSAAPIPTSNES